MIKNVVFDMGNVLIHFDPALFVQREGFSGKDAQLLVQEVFQTSEWVQMDRGTLAEEKALEQMYVRLPEHLHAAAKHLVYDWDKPIIPMEGMQELCRELKNAGYGVYLLSNARVCQHEYWPRVPGNELFDGTLISADYRLMKPEKAIYELLCQKFSLKPEECVFIDDSPTNIEGSIQAGMKGIVFYGDMERLRAGMRRVGITDV